MAIHAVVKVRPRPAGVSGIPDITKHVARVDEISFAERTEAIEMGIVVPFEAGTEHTHDLASETIHSHPRDDAAGCCNHRCAFGRKNVDALMAPTAGPRRSPRIGEPHRRESHRGWQRTRRRFAGERVDEPDAFDDWPEYGNRHAEHSCRQGKKQESFHRGHYKGTRLTAGGRAAQPFTVTDLARINCRGHEAQSGSRYKRLRGASGCAVSATRCAGQCVQLLEKHFHVAW
jgi:hypothetical protein